MSRKSSSSYRDMQAQNNLQIIPQINSYFLQGQHVKKIQTHSSYQASKRTFKCYGQLIIPNLHFSGFLNARLSESESSLL